MLRSATLARRTHCLLAALALATASCTADDPRTVPRTIAAEAVTIAADGDGSFLWANLGGDVRDEAGSLVATVEVSSEGQRGLLGLTRSTDGRVFVAYTDPGEQMIVAEVGGAGDDRVVWEGPQTVGGGNGGRLVSHPDGHLILGLGLLGDRSLQADPDAVVGKLISLDPDGPPDQQPTIISGPWNNPFAFDVGPDGAIWVADNHPRDGDEVLARGDLGLDPDPTFVFPADSAPTGLTIIDSTTLVVCNFNTRRLMVLRVDAAEPADDLAADCRLDVARLSDGSIAYSTGDAIRVLAP